MTEDLQSLPCSRCQSGFTRYDSVFGFWECMQCGNVWSDGANDPDHDDEALCPECQVGSLEDYPDGWSCSICGAFIYDPPYNTRNIERMMMWGRQPNEQN